MNDSALPPSFVARLAEFERRLGNVERSPRLTNASITGYLKLNNALGNQQFFVGTNLIGEQVLVIGTPASPAMWWTSTDGLTYPYETTPFIDFTTFKSITSGTFAVQYVTRVGTMQCTTLNAAVYVSAPVGTSYEVKFRNVSTGAEQTLVVAGTGGTQLVDLKWRHGLPLTFGPYQFEWQVRRSAGAGTVAFFEPFGVVQGAFSVATFTWTVI